MRKSYFVPLKKWWILGAVGLLAAAASVVTGGSADKPPSKVEETLAYTVKRVVIPILARDLPNPFRQSEEIVQEGQELFLQACAVCHGADGRAETHLGRGMYPPTLDLTSPNVRSWKDAELFWIIQNGIRLTGMPGLKSMISAEDTWKLVHFLRSLPHRNGSHTEAPVTTASGATATGELIAYGRTVYLEEACFACHRLRGEGGTFGPPLTFQGERGRTDEWLLGHFNDPPAYVKGSIMPPFQNLSGVQTRALVAFLQSQKED